MGKYICSILNVIDNVNDYKDFSNRTAYFGLELKNKGSVSDVKIISDLEITGKVTEKQVYSINLKMESPKRLKMRCDCLSDNICIHQVALIYYIKERIENLDYDYCIASDLTTNSFTTSILEKLDNLSYWSIRSVGIKRIEALNKKIYENIDYLLRKSPNEETNYLFYRILNYFLKTQFKHFDEQYQDEFTQTFYDIMSNNIKVWRQVFNKINIIYFIPIFKECLTFVDNVSKADYFLKFIEATIKEINRSKYFIEYADNIKRDLILISLKVAEKYYDRSAFIDYFKKVAIYHNEIEALLAINFFKNNEYQAITEYIQTSRSNASTINLANLAINYKMKKITVDEFIKKAVDIFKEQCKIVDFNFLKLILDESTFSNIQDKLLRLAKKNDKYSYYEMLISLDKEEGYNLVKAAGIFEFNKHVENFLPEKEEELILYYQEELTNFFSKSKGTGIRFHEAMAACKKLEKMKNGKYYLFSVYRLANARHFEYSEALQELYSYVYQLDL